MIDLNVPPDFAGDCSICKHYFVYFPPGSDLLSSARLPDHCGIHGSICPASHRHHHDRSHVRFTGAYLLIPPLSQLFTCKSEQALIFILKREFMLCGWMVVYILSYVLSNMIHIFSVTNDAN